MHCFDLYVYFNLAALSFLPLGFKSRQEQIFTVKHISNTRGHTFISYFENKQVRRGHVHWSQVDWAQCEPFPCCQQNKSIGCICSNINLSQSKIILKIWIWANISGVFCYFNSLDKVTSCSLCAWNVILKVVLKSYPVHLFEFKKYIFIEGFRLKKNNLWERRPIWQVFLLLKTERPSRPFLKDLWSKFSHSATLHQRRWFSQPDS